MKKFICIILSVTMLGCVIGCGNTNADVEKYDLTIIGGEDILKPLASSYKAGRAVKFQLPRVDAVDTDIVISVCLDGVAIKRDVTYIGMVAYFEYNFTMPAHDVVLTIEYIDKYYENMQGEKVEFDVLLDETDIDLGIGTFVAKHEIFSTSDKWSEFLESLDDQAVGYLDKYDDTIFTEYSLIVISNPYSHIIHKLEKIKIVKTSQTSAKKLLTAKLYFKTGDFQSYCSRWILIRVKKQDVGDCDLKVEIKPVVGGYTDN